MPEKLKCTFPMQNAIHTQCFEYLGDEMHECTVRHFLQTLMIWPSEIRVVAFLPYQMRWLYCQISVV